MSIEAMKQALEALDSDNPDIQLRAAQALRTAIAEAEKQEPVGEICWAANVPNSLREAVWFDYVSPPVGTKLYTTPPAAQRQPLTEEQIDDIWNRYCDEMGEASINDAYDIARAIEAAHGITGEKT